MISRSLCEICNKTEATVFVTTAVHGESSPAVNNSYCEECARRNGAFVDVDTRFPNIESCVYCGNELCNEQDILSKALSKAIDSPCPSTMCSRSTKEYSRFIEVAFPAVRERELKREDMKAVVSVFAEVNVHMKQWILELKNEGKA